MAKSAMPVSKAKTAYGLLSEIRKLILEEPRRYDQTAWKRSLSEIPRRFVPACGTVCCVAGWVDTLRSKYPVPTDRASFAMGVRSYLVAENAMEILGLDSDQADELFDGEKAGPRYKWHLGIKRPFEIAPHARRGAAHIRRFQKKYAKKLRAKRV